MWLRGVRGYLPKMRLISVLAERHRRRARLARGRVTSEHRILDAEDDGVLELETMHLWIVKILIAMVSEWSGRPTLRCDRNR